MEFVQAVILFALGVGAAFLAYFAWHHVDLSTSTMISTNGAVIPTTLPSHLPSIVNQSV